MPDEAGAPRVVLVTHPSEGAEGFAQSLVAARLAACVNLCRVTSFYRWEGQVQADAEALLIVKTTSDHVAALEAFLRTRHPYDVPECVVLDPVHVEERYARWLGESCSVAGAD